jgi:hypothetical protein
MNPKQEKTEVKQEKNEVSCTSPSGFSLVTISDSSNDESSEIEFTPEVEHKRKIKNLNVKKRSLEIKERTIKRTRYEEPQTSEAESDQEPEHHEPEHHEPEHQEIEHQEPQQQHSIFDSTDMANRNPSPPPTQPHVQQPTQFQHPLYHPQFHPQLRPQNHPFFQHQQFHPLFRCPQPLTTQHHQNQQHYVYRPISLNEQNAKNINHLLTVLYKDSLDRNENLASMLENMNNVANENK